MRKLPVNCNSIFGKVPEIYHRRIKSWKNKNLNMNENFLIVDCVDGLFGMYPLRSGFNIDAYETRSEFLFGGKVNIPIYDEKNKKYVIINKTMIGFEDKITEFLLDNQANLYNCNYYLSDNNNEYLYVVASNSLEREENKNIPMSSKIEKLQNSVKTNGILYIKYLVAFNEDNYEKYPSNSYLRENEILKYFNLNEWTILDNSVELKTYEPTPINLEKRSVLEGNFEARKIPTRIKKETIKRRKIINDKDRNTIEVNHKYIINGEVFQ